ncbi:MAG: hypothetical protein U0821_17135 [Chloroflexota bacterium]
MMELVVTALVAGGVVGTIVFSLVQPRTRTIWPPLLCGAAATLVAAAALVVYVLRLSA